MKNSKIVICLLCLFAAAPAMADLYVGSADLTRVNGYYSGRGGEFTLYNTSLSTLGYSSDTKNVYGGEYSFQTFCVETDEYVLPPYEVEAWVSTSGPTGSQARLGGYNTNSGDPLDPRTAYLYTKFATGTLAGYDYDGSGRSSSADDLQKAIWFIEGELWGVENDFVDLANDAITGGGSTDEWIGVGIGNVRVLNMYAWNSLTSTWDPKQDMLYLVPVPGAVMLGVLGLGVAGWKLRRFGS